MGACTSRPLQLSTQARPQTKKSGELKLAAQIAEYNQMCDGLADALTTTSSSALLADLFTLTGVSLGSGAYSTVRLAVDQSTGEQVRLREG